ncbi:crotonobetainyl-CoA:carnitine CoA-transferase CaiB-like acyl-CoA transferase [Nocardiopsis terrae]|uniref:Crotonobetainyl-CoA:carnitine CoA-transferase CaiB-like acyl-CoA transferase n=1 Tax=Nocardiopsis terrae TaxID=372655 RepID=A0ABR9HMV0_9ACTN|nr:CoA transferase [Nocardiopsis terrae]MBE1460354.1 crotonobetainyl-CoA:carnitine CoA-transferase CaiB-like acyl-CoA transferase [Nocardiopsis terrae]
MANERGSGPDRATTRAWQAIGGAADLVERVSYRGAGEVLPAALPVRELARATVGACSLAAAELLAVRNGGPVPGVPVDEGAVATAFVSERHLLVDGRKPTSFAPLSGFWRAADGWVRTHANYPHHRARLLSALGLGTGTGPDGLAEELLSRTAHQIQETVYAQGGLAVAMAPVPGPGGGPGGAGEFTAAGLPLAGFETLGGVGDRRLPPAALPAAGVRVLDLTRVIAGPVATRTLALLGADVLRVDAPGLPEDPDSHTDTGTGKRSTLLDLATDEGRSTFEALLDTADAVVTGYRPGALDRHGLVAEELIARRPGLVVAQLCAWGWTGPWAERRGFDSLVQAASGIAAIEAGPDGRPGALPAQALDHGTGYLLAAGVLRALTERQADGRGRRLRFSLAGTAGWLLNGIDPEPAAEGGYDAGAWLTGAASPYGPLRYALPPVRYEGGPGDWAAPATRWGSDPALWL